MIALIPVRGGALPKGADETVAEADGRALVTGSGTEQAAKELTTARHEILCAELGAFAPGAWAAALAPYLDDPIIVLPASPDGRDLAPRIAHILQRPLFAPAIAVDPNRVILTRRGGLVAEEHRVDGPIVATLEPGVRGTTPTPPTTTRALDISAPPRADALSLDVRPPDPQTVDLSEAARIVSGGAGLGGPEPFDLLRRVAAAIDAAWGASRVAADAGWVPQERFIGTTGVTIGANLYIALGISGAVQHVSGLGDPDHIIAVNTDASAPMMTMADLAVVTDARTLLEELADRLGVQR